MKKLIWIVLFLAFCFPLQAQLDTVAIETGANARSLPDSFIIIGKPILGSAGMFSSKADGMKTASGEIFSNMELTGACNKFKFGTWVRVTNLKNKKTVLVRINDRTSKKPSAPIIEMSRAAVTVLGYLKTGNANVKLEEISVINLKPEDNSNIELSEKIISKKTIDTSNSTSTYQTKGKPITGIASFYSANLDGTKTATGERYRNKKLTAASNNFKLNTLVLVTNQKNNKSVIVRINDRMHPRMKKKGRVVDLSGSAAQALDMVKDGLVKVKVQEISFLKDGPPDLSETDSLASVIKDTSTSVTIIDSVKTDSVQKKETVITGLAGSYAANLEGSKTASGEIIRNTKLTAISNRFEINTFIKVTNTRNNKSVIVRIIDRFPVKMKKNKKLLDLSKAASKKLDFTKKTPYKVKIEVLNKQSLN